MKTGIRELRDGLSRHLAHIRRGEEITITDRGRDLAVIRPVRSRRTLEQTIVHLCEEGVLEPAEPWEPLRPRRQRLKGRLLSALVLEERRRGW
jgi:prevent-host-death family protein